MKIPSELSYWLLTGLVILFGSITHATNKLKVAREKKEPFTMVDFIILLPLSMFSGGVFGLIGIISVPDNPYMIVLFAAMGSFLGIAGLNSLGIAILQFANMKLTGNNNITPKKDDKKGN